MNAIYLKIIIPNGVFYEGEIDILTLKTARGYIGIQKGHSPFFSSVEIGNLTINWSNSEKSQNFYIGGGIIYADQKKINIITDDIINAKDIDINRAKSEIENLQTQIKQNKDTVDILKLETKLKKALFRVETYNLYNK